PEGGSLGPASGGGSGTSTPPQLLPPSDEKYARIGTRKISFEPAVSMLGLLALSVPYVSPCGPHSFDTSTFGPTSVEAVRPPPLIGPFWARYRYLFHQVGLCELSAGWAAASGRDGAVAPGGSWHATARTPTASTKWRVRVIDSSHPGPLEYPRLGGAGQTLQNERAGRGGGRGCPHGPP